MNYITNPMEVIGAKEYPLISSPHPDTAEIHFGYWKIPMGSDKLSICPKLVKILGLRNAGKMRLKDIFEFIDAAYLGAFKNWIRNAATERVMEPLKFRIRTRRDESKWIKLTGLHYSRRWQSPKMMLGTIEDITNYVNDEKAALAIVNHELRNSLAVIKLNAQLLEKTVNKNENFSPAALAAVIVRSTDGITSVLDQYLSEKDALTMAGQGAVEFDMADLIAETLLNFKALHPGYTFSRQAAVKCPVKADRFQIGQVLVNYLNNAVKFSPANSRISVMVNTGFSGIDVGVIDEGIGVPDGQEKRIFDRFYKIENSSAPKDSSRGLGLFLVKEIIERHKGSVWVQKSRSGGSIFFFRLPGYQPKN